MMSNQLKSTCYHYTHLPTEARTLAVREVREYAASSLSKHQAQLEEVRSESFNEDIDSMALGRKTKAIEYLVEQSTTFLAMTEDDVRFIEFLRKDTLLFEESGELIGESAAHPENQVLRFDQYIGDWYNKYTAESEDYTYTIIGMHGDRSYTCSGLSKDQKSEDMVNIEIGTISGSIRHCQQHHTVHLQKKRDAVTA